MLQVGEIFHLPETKRLAQALFTHETAGAATRINQPLIAQALQGVTHHWARHLEFSGHCVLGRQALIDVIGSRFDGTLDTVENSIGKTAPHVESFSHD